MFKFSKVFFVVDIVFGTVGIYRILDFDELDK